MVDYVYQNDYVFINKQFGNILSEINIREDIQSEYIDHLPIDFKINL